MHLLSSKVERVIDRLVRFAYGDQALVNEALALYNREAIPDPVEYIRTHRREPGRSPGDPPASAQHAPQA